MWLPNSVKVFFPFPKATIHDSSSINFFFSGGRFWLDSVSISNRLVSWRNFSAQKKLVREVCVVKVCDINYLGKSRLLERKVADIWRNRPSVGCNSWDTSPVFHRQRRWGWLDQCLPLSNTCQFVSRCESSPRVHRVQLLVRNTFRNRKPPPMFALVGQHNRSKCKHRPVVGRFVSFAQKYYPVSCQWIRKSVSWWWSHSTRPGWWDLQASLSMDRDSHWAGESPPVLTHATGH